VTARIEEWVRQEKYGRLELPAMGGSADGNVSDQLCRSACDLANNLGAAAIFVYTRRGYMARFLSRYRPDSPIFAFTPDQSVRRRLNLHWGVMPFRMDFSDDPEENVNRTFKLMLSRGLVKTGDLVVVLSDLGSSRRGEVLQKEGSVRSIQIRKVGASAGEIDNSPTTTGTKGMGRGLKERLLEAEKAAEEAAAAMAGHHDGGDKGGGSSGFGGGGKKDKEKK
jgi:hypothetical protein